MKKLAASILLLGLLSTSQAEGTYYVPIHNLAPIGYNPLTTNYNPDYDNYTWLGGSGSGNSVKMQSTNAERDQLNKQYKEHVDAMVDAGSLRDSVRNSVLASHDRARLNQLDSQYRNRISNMGNGGFFDLLRDGALANQDRQMMNAITGVSGSGGCGSRGGPGWRKANGQCASWSD